MNNVCYQNPEGKTSVVDWDWNHKEAQLENTTPEGSAATEQEGKTTAGTEF